MDKYNAELVVATKTAKEIIFLYRQYGSVIKETPILQVDNSAVVKLSQNPEFRQRSKHIDANISIFEKR